MEKKITKRDMLTALRAFIETDENREIAPSTDDNPAITTNDVLAFIDHEIELLNKRNSRSRKSGDGADELTDAIMSVLGTDEFMTIPDILVAVSNDDLTPGKVSSRMSKLAKSDTPAVESGTVKVADTNGKTRTLKAYRKIAWA